MAIKVIQKIEDIKHASRITRDRLHALSARTFTDVNPHDVSVTRSSDLVRIRMELQDAISGVLGELRHGLSA